MAGDTCSVGKGVSFLGGDGLGGERRRRDNLTSSGRVS